MTHVEIIIDFSKLQIGIFLGGLWVGFMAGVIVAILLM